LVLLSILTGCSHEREDRYYGDYQVMPDTGWQDFGSGGATPYLTFPFPSGKYWVITRGYNTGSHTNYGFEYGDDRYALDFSRNGCDAYGEPVTPLSEGVVIKVTTDGSGDQGYGNSVIIDHGGGFHSRYAHFSEILVDVGDYVDSYDYIGKVGNSGNCEGSACSTYPGTHLHMVIYRDNAEGWPVSVKPEPMSGVWDFYTGCWYNREGVENCSGDPGDYERSDLDDEGKLNISYLGISPNNGTADDTVYVWSAVVDSVDATPWATLKIYNSNDGVTYNFEMERVTDEGPWVFVYRKSLNDPLVYSYWVEASNGDGNDISGVQTVSVGDDSNSVPYVYDFDWSPSSGNADSTEFEWDVEFRSDYYPDVTLHILNPNDAWVYDFDMDLDGVGDHWSASYEKTLNDPTTYPFWVTVDNGVSASSSEVGSVEVH